MRRVFFLFAYSPFNVYGLVGGGGGKGSLQILLSAVALLVCMPAGLEHKQCGTSFYGALPV